MNTPKTKCWTMNEHAIYIKKFFIAYNYWWKVNFTENRSYSKCWPSQFPYRDLLIQFQVWQPNSVTKWGVRFTVPVYDCVYLMLTYCLLNEKKLWSQYNKLFKIVTLQKNNQSFISFGEEAWKKSHCGFSLPAPSSRSPERPQALEEAKPLKLNFYLNYLGHGEIPVWKHN